MSAAKKILLILGIIGLTLQVDGEDKYTDENRPYEFGFSIDGEQHRHEKKDKNGIIMGEFGFITADGVYHVTVYATDEQGRFKILSMKNIRVKPYPSAASQNSRTGHSLSLPPSQKSLPESSSQISTPLSETKQQLQIKSTTTDNDQKSKVSPFELPPASPVKSCSHCSLPTTTTLAPKLANPISPSHDTLLSLTFDDKQEKNNNKNNENNNYNQNNYNTNNYGPINNPPYSVNNNPTLNNEEQQHLQDNNSDLKNSQNGYGMQNKPLYDNVAPSLAGQNQQEFYNAPKNNINQGSKGLGNLDIYPSNPSIQDSQGSPQKETEFENNPTAISGGRSPKRYEPQSEPVGPQNTLEGNNQNALRATNLPDVPPKKPMLISAQMQIVDKNTDIYHKNPGESDGLPEGVTKDYMEHVLYVFNYTVGFHGHYEKGYSNGAKQGYYYVTGRNGVRTRVDYEADEKGFRPKISQEVLDLLSDDVPKPETEKEPKYGLKNYEFKWLYFPVESKQQT